MLTLKTEPAPDQQRRMLLDACWELRRKAMSPRLFMELLSNDVRFLLLVLPIFDLSFRISI